MKKFSLIVLMAAILGFYNSAIAVEKVAVIDVQAVVTNSKQVIALKDEQQKKIEDLQKWLINVRKEIEKQKTDEAKAKVAKKYEAEYVKKQEAMRKDYMEKLKKIDKSINDTIASKAKEKGYDMVIAKGAVVFGGDDITEEIVKAVK
ncbi:OmpH family outer membrane protein [bacterium]|nr:OmpH family outer membrane protein [bacterium]